MTKIDYKLKYNRAREILKGYASLKDNDLCHDHPELLKALCEVFDVQVSHPHGRVDISEEEFEINCGRWRDHVFRGCPYIPARLNDTHKD